MEALQLHQALVDAGMPSSGAAAKSFFKGLAQRLGIPAAAATPKQQFFDLLTHLLGKAPSLACSWLSDYLAVSTTLVSSDPEEAYVLQPEAVLAWAQQAAAGLQQRVGAFLCAGPSARGDAVLELQQTAQALLSVAAAVQAVSSSSTEAQQLVSSLQQLQHATKALQVLEQLQQQQQLPSPGRPTPKGPSGSTPASSSGDRSGLGQQPLFKPRNAACTEWQQRLEQRRQAAAGGHLFLDDLMSALQHAARLPDSSPALTYPYPDVLTCINTLFVNAGSAGSSGGSGSSGSSSEAWHAKLSLLLYYLLDGGWLGSAEPFAQGFQLPMTLVQQWQCHYLLDAAAAVGGSSSGTGSSMAAAGSTAALDSACHLLGAIACPSTPFRFVEALLAAGRPATALAVQRARCGGGSGSSSSPGSSSLSEAEVLLRVQLGCGLLAEAFCDLRRHCGQVPVIKRSLHISSLMRQLADWALSPAPAAASSTAGGAADTAASHMAAQLQLQDSSQLLPAGTSPAAAAVAAVTGGGWDACKARQQALLQLPLDASEEGVLVVVLRERMAAGQIGGHLLPLYFLQRGRTLEALSAYADYKASPAAEAASVSDAAPDAAAAAAASRALLHRRLDAVMCAAAAALPPALRSAAAAAGTSSSSSSGGGGAGGVVRPVLQGLGASEARRLQGYQAAEGGSVLLQRRGVEPPAFLAPLLYAAAAAGGGAAAAAAAAAAPVAAARSGGGGQFSAGALRGGGSSRRAAGQGTGSSSSVVAGKEGKGAAAVARPLLFEEEVLAEAGPGTVRLGGATKGEQGGKNATGDGDVVPLLFGTPAPAAAAATAGGRTPGNVVRGGLFDTPVGGPGAALWAQQTPGGGAAAGGLAGFAGMSEADFERQVRFATPQPKTAAAGAAAGGVFTHTGKRSHKRMRKTPI